MRIIVGGLRHISVSEKSNAVLALFQVRSAWIHLELAYDYLPLAWPRHGQSRYASSARRGVCAHMRNISLSLSLLKNDKLGLLNQILRKAYSLGVLEANWGHAKRTAMSLKRHVVARSVGVPLSAPKRLYFEGEFHQDL